MFELYSQRIKNEKGEPEVFIYDSFSFQFRNQLFYIVADVYDYLEHSYSRESWKYLHDSFARELGVKQLSRFFESYGQERRGIEGFISEAPESELLDFIDFTFAVIYNLMNQPDLRNRKDIISQFEKAIKELNHRFRQHSLGYEFVQGEIIRKDSELLHREAVKPVLRLLLDGDFTEAEQQILAAFEYRRKGEKEKAILAASKALEGTMRAICVRSGYLFDEEESTVEDLTAVLDRNGFYPAPLSAQTGVLGDLLKSGVHPPADEDKEAASQAFDGVMDYALNLAAASILLHTRLYAAKNPGPDDDIALQREEQRIGSGGTGDV